MAVMAVVALIAKCMNKEKRPARNTAPKKPQVDECTTGQ